MTLAAGRYDRKIAYHRLNSPAAQDGYGAPAEVWGSIGQDWAEVRYGRGDERRAVAREEGAQTAVFVVRSHTLSRSITVRDRLVLDGGSWDILGISPMHRGSIEFTARRAL